MFPKLSEARLRLVPDEVSDDEFWRNFFYHIELFKKEQGYDNTLGERVDANQRDAAIEQEVAKAEQEIKRLEQKEAEEAAATGKVEVELQEMADDEDGVNTEHTLANMTGTAEMIELQ